jgi:hypothetical protein
LTPVPDRRHLLALSLLAFLIGLLMAALHSGLHDRLAYPPASDQTMYLAGGTDFARHFRFFWRAPLYGAWMGFFYLLAGDDPQSCFYLEKYASFAVFSVSTAYLGYRLFDLRTGMLMGVWALNCKYLALETNGSHVLAATLFVFSLLCLLRRDAARLPASLLMLFLATQVRSEMWGPFLAIVAVLAAGSIRRRREFVWKPWLVCAAIGLGLALLFNSRLSPEEPGRLSEAFAMNFALNYLDRHPLETERTHEKENWMQVWVDALPGVSPSADAIARDRREIRPFDAIRRYPREMIAHAVYNLKLAVVALPAVFLSFDRRALMLAAIVLYLLSFTVRKGEAMWLGSWDSFPPDAGRLVLGWAVALCLLIPICFVLRVVARYFIPLIPIQIALAVLMLRAITNSLGANRIGRTGFNRALQLFRLGADNTEKGCGDRNPTSFK